MAQPASLAATKVLVIMVPPVATIAAVLVGLSPAWSFVGPQVCPSFQVGICVVCYCCMVFFSRLRLCHVIIPTTHVYDTHCLLCSLLPSARGYSKVGAVAGRTKVTRSSEG